MAIVVALADPNRAQTLLDEAEVIARSINRPLPQAQVWVHLAAAVASSDPCRSLALLVEAEAIASTLHPHPQALALRQLADAVASIDPRRAEAIARTITVQIHQARALRSLVLCP